MASDPNPAQEADTAGTSPTAKRLQYGLFALGAILLAIDPLVHKHGPFEIEHLWGFYALYPMIGCIALILIARILTSILRRSEDYYDC